MWYLTTLLLAQTVLSPATVTSDIIDKIQERTKVIEKEITEISKIMYKTRF